MEKTLVRDYKAWLLDQAFIEDENEEHKRHFFYNWVLNLLAEEESCTQVDYDKVVSYRKELEEKYKIGVPVRKEENSK